MDGHSFVSALLCALCALIGFDTFVPKPIFVHSLSLPSSSLSSSLLDSLSPVSSTVEKQQQKQPSPVLHQQQQQKSSSSTSKSRANNNSVGNNANSNSIPMSKSKQICKISEWKCPNGTCIPLSKYCNGIPDCSDKSDEPSGCSGKPIYFDIESIPIHILACHISL